MAREREHDRGEGAARERDDRDDAGPIGFMAAGPGFHVWEATHGDAARSASQLAGALSLEQARAVSRARARRPEPTDTD